MNRISTGVKMFDDLLGGGYEIDSITTVYGPAGSGKTNMAILSAISMASQGKKVLYIDTEGGFSIERFKQVTSNFKKVLSNIIFLQPTNFQEQKRAFEKLKGLANSKVGLIIVDTITMLYRLQKSNGEEVSETNKDLAMQIGILNEIARKQNIPVLLTNQVYTSFDDGRIQVVGGDIIKYSSKCLLEIQTFHANKRKLILRKHRSIPGEKEVYFEIVQEGIREA